MTAQAPWSTASPPREAPAGVLWLADGGRRSLVLVVLPLLVIAGAAWWLTARTSDMMLGAGPFLLAWTIMMVAMMLPATAPVVALYALAARRGVVAAMPFFVAGYLGVWAVTGIPAYLISRVVSEPLMEGEPWVGRIVGATVLTAALYQLTPLKDACLRRCRSPLSFFLTRKGSLSTPSRSVAAGAQHGLACLVCCWALMAVLAVLGGMQLGWAVALAVVLSAEKLFPAGWHVASIAASVGAVLGLSLLTDPTLLDHLMQM
ncbi:MAG: DUF2182 domain-containing protein [Mycobacteriales bacterium]